MFSIVAPISLSPNPPSDTTTAPSATSDGVTRVVAPIPLPMTSLTSLTLAPVSTAPRTSTVLAAPTKTLSSLTTATLTPTRTFVPYATSPLVQPAHTPELIEQPIGVRSAIPISSEAISRVVAAPAQGSHTVKLGQPATTATIGVARPSESAPPPAPPVPPAPEPSADQITTQKAPPSEPIQQAAAKPTNWALIGGIGAAAAVVAYLAFSKKKGR